MPNINTLGQNMKGEFATEFESFYVYVTLTFEPKVTSLISIAYCYLHPIDHHFAKYEPPLANNEWRFAFTSPKTCLITCDLDLCLQGHIRYLKSLS